MSFTPAPKPKRKPPKARTPLRRSAWIQRSTKPIRPRNAKRHGKAWKRAYYSVERVLWIKARRCIRCLKGPCVNAHIRNDGMSQKGPYWEILPMCFDCDRRYEANDVTLRNYPGLYPVTSTWASNPQPSIATNKRSLNGRLTWFGLVICIPSASRTFETTRSMIKNGR